MANVVATKDLHRIVLTCIIHKDGKYLVTRRSTKAKAFPGRWTVPGGGVETAEYLSTPKTTSDAWYHVLEKTIKREVKEEVNLEIGRPTYLLDLFFVRPDGIPALVLSYYAPYVSGEVKLEKDDPDDYKWVTAKEAKAIDMISGIAEEIEEVDRILNA